MYETMESTSDQKQYHPSIMPLLSRIDRLETTMRRLEMKQINVSSSSGCSTANTVSPSNGVTSEQQEQPVTIVDMDMEHLKETNIKCTLLERIKTLENRLFQLKLRVESEKMESRTRRSEVPPSSCSFPIFMMNPNNNNAYKKQVVPNASIINNNVESEAKNNKDHQVISSGQEDDEEEPANKHHQKKQKNTKTKKPKTGQKDKDETRKKKQKKMSKPERENIKSLNWPHLKILGC